MPDNQLTKESRIRKLAFEHQKERRKEKEEST